MSMRLSNAGRRRAFTLTELMVTMTVVGVLAAFSAPSFQRAMEQSRADIATANLRAIWAAERLYWLDNHVYTANIDTIKNLGILDKAIPSNTSDSLGGYKYAIESATPASEFTATATNSDAGVTITIDENGTIESTGIVLGFQ